MSTMIATVWDSEFYTPILPRLKSVTVNAIRNQPAVPIRFVSFEEIGVDADQAITLEEAVFGFAGKSAS